MPSIHDGCRRRFVFTFVSLSLGLTDGWHSLTDRSRREGGDKPVLSPKKGLSRRSYRHEGLLTGGILSPTVHDDGRRACVESEKKFVLPFS